MPTLPSSDSERQAKNKIQPPPPPSDGEIVLFCAHCDIGPDYIHLKAAHHWYYMEDDPDGAPGWVIPHPHLAEAGK